MKINEVNRAKTDALLTGMGANHAPQASRPLGDFLQGLAADLLAQSNIHDDGSVVVSATVQEDPAPGPGGDGYLSLNRLRQDARWGNAGNHNPDVRSDNTGAAARLNQNVQMPQRREFAATDFAAGFRPEQAIRANAHSDSVWNTVLEDESEHSISERSLADDSLNASDSMPNDIAGGARRWDDSLQSGRAADGAADNNDGLNLPRRRDSMDSTS